MEKELFILLLLCVIIPIALYIASTAIKRNRMEESRELPDDFEPTMNVEGHFSIDENNHKFALGSFEKFFDFEQLVSYYYKENDETIFQSKGSIGRAIAGGILAGGVGAIIGAGTSKSKGTIDISEMRISIITNPGAVVDKVEFLGCKTTKNSFLYNNAYDNVQKVLAMLKIIENYNHENFNLETDQSEQLEQNQLSNSVPEQIKQYKELLDIGAITQEEFEAKKKQLLGL